MIIKKPKVFITRRLPKKIETRMMELFDTTLNEKDTLLNEEQLILPFVDNEISVIKKEPKIKILDEDDGYHD